MRRAPAWLAGFGVIVAAGLSLGFWLWLGRVPSVRLLLPSGGVAYLHAPSVASLPGFLVLGVGGLGLTWVALGLVLSRLERVPFDEILRRSAAPFLPMLLLLVDGARLLLPLGWLTNAGVILTYEARWVVAGGVVVAVCVLHTRLLPEAAWRLRLRPGRLAFLTFVGVWLVYLAFLPRAVLVGPTGDEPDYLLLAHSLVVDRDFDLRNNVENRDYLRFRSGLQPHVREGPGGAAYSIHRLGLPVLISPAYGLGLLAGWPVRIPVMVLLAFLAALLVARTVSWALHLTGDALSSLGAGLALAFSAPGFFYAYAIFPEVPAALIVLEVLRRLGPLGGHAPWIVGWLLAALPWFHERFAPLTLVLAGSAVWVFGRRARVLAGVLIPLAASAVLQAAYYTLLYGRPVPVGVHQEFAPPSSIHTGLVGLWLDRDHGLLPLAPLYVLAWAGIPSFFREQRRLATVALVAFLSLYGVVGANLAWRGGFSPAPRHLVALLPIMGAALAFGIRAARVRGRAIRILILAGVSALGATYAVIYPALQYRHAHPFRSLFPGIDWTRYLPAWAFPDERTLPLTGLVLVVVGLLVSGRIGFAHSPTSGGRLTAAGCVTLGVVAGVVLVGDSLAGVSEPHLTQEGANRELQAFLIRVEGRGALRASPRWEPESVRLVYEAERLPGQGQDIVQDPLAGNGLARSGGYAGGDLVFGPYETLPRGDYRASFRLRGESVSVGPVAMLAITSAGGLVAAREVSRADVWPDEYREVDLDFTLPVRTSHLEWRVRLVQAGAIRVDRISIIPRGLRVVERAAP